MTTKDDNRVVISDPFAKRLMVRYLQHRQDDICILRTALADGDFDAIRDKGHNLFGSGSAYGLDAISELGAALEKTAKKKNGADIAQLIEKLETFVSNVRVT